MANNTAAFLLLLQTELIASHGQQGAETADISRSHLFIRAVSPAGILPGLRARARGTTRQMDAGCALRKG